MKIIRDSWELVTKVGEVEPGSVVEFNGDLCLVSWDGNDDDYCPGRWLVTLTDGRMGFVSLQTEVILCEATVTVKMPTKN